MSADLFAAFEDFSQPPQKTPQQTQSKHSSTQSASTPFSFAAPWSQSGQNSSQNSSQQWRQSASALGQSQHAWQTSQALATHNARPAPVAASAFAGPQPTSDDDAVDDDGWGDFEVATNPGLPSSGPLQAELVMPKSVAMNQPIRPVVRASTLDLVSNNLVHCQEVSTGPTWPPVNSQPASKSMERKVPTKVTHADPNVLFDADDFEGDPADNESDDDFGEFETVSPTVQPPPDLISSALPMPSMSNTNIPKASSELLLDLNFSELAPTYTQTAKTMFVSGQATAPKQELKGSKLYLDTAQPRNTQAQTKVKDGRVSFPGLPDQPVRSPIKSAEPTSDWGWDSVESPKSIKFSGSPIKKNAAPQNQDNAANEDDSSWNWDPVDIDPVGVKSKSVTDIENGCLPPVNIPPPSIILSAFPQFFDQANDYLYKPVSKQPSTIKDRILSDPRVYDFLGGFLSLATVAARIMAGRKLRWHRDKYLSQSMSISAAGSKGMKLAGVDKTQAVREDREAADVVSNWKSQVGRLKSTVAAANLANKNGERPLKIPEITDTMQVQTVKGVPTSAKACVICGLKRNERLPRVDYDVEDSFGEWWVEHWGHVACKRFWLQHENTLRQR
ncbi:hypothetical protein GGR50DRAFT_643885 [Xylaria sp. CBS 124048]|nr:hypothetical protein GGR50DRAFT_643885 [Xylaria sp. CBS 124048]